MSEAAKDRTALASAGPPQPIAFRPPLRAQTGPRSGWSGWLREASAERTVVVDRSVKDVLPHLWKIKTVEFCERKADRVIVTPESPSAGRYLIRGRIFGLLSWSGQFRYVLHESGFHSQDAAARRGGLKVNGGHPFTGSARTYRSVEH